MRVALAVLLFASAVLALPAGKYTTKFDGIDLDEILNNSRLFDSYYKCLLGGRCTAEGRELRANLPDALQTACSKCSDKQKSGTEKVLKFLIEKKPTEYAELEKKYDPDGKYKDRYKEEIAKRTSSTPS